MAVDDNDAFRYAITRVVERGGHRPVAAANGEEALRLAKLQQPDLILLDVNMPDLQGYEVCRRLKNDRATAHIPVVFLSATAKSQSAIEECIKAGGESFLFSPVEPDQLLAVVHAALVKQSRIGAPA
jgi:CheY-like chemotaxis protein